MRPMFLAGWVLLGGTLTAVAGEPDFSRSAAAFREGRGRVVFLGGSITEAAGWRVEVARELERRFPHCEFTFHNAGVASTGSTAGAFRLHRDVLAQGPPDLLFVEAAVNDDQDEQLSAAEAVQGMEGIVRQVRRDCPKTDIVMIHFVNPHILERLRAGREVVSIAAHDRVAERYGVPVVNIAAAVAAGEMTWEEYGGTHPKEAGHRFAAGKILARLDAGWPGEGGPHSLPEPLDAESPAGGRLFAPGELKELELTGGFAVGVPDWSGQPGEIRSRFRKETLLHADAAGAEATFTVMGRSVGAYLLAGPDAGALQVTIDDGEPSRVELRHEHSRGLHYPRMMVFARGLPLGPHRVRFRTVAGEAGGTACRIVAVAVDRGAAE